MERQIIPIVLATDENFVPYCGVAISSLIMNANPDFCYEIFILYERLTCKSIYRLEQLSNDYIKVTCCCIEKYFYCIEKYFNNKHIIEHRHLSIATTFRLLIPDIFPHYEKIIYLDSDIIVNADIAQLYNIDIGNSILGAVQGYYKRDSTNFVYNHLKETLGINIENFFNAGVLIINIEEFNLNTVAEKCYSLLEERNDLYFMDQCTLNIVCEGRVHFLPKKWNFEWLYLLEADDSSLMCSGDISNPAIIHYIGAEKPWDYPEYILSDYFWKYARQTIFYEEILLLTQLRKTKELYDIQGLIKENKNIVIYGAGNIGKKYVRRILSLKLCNIVLWVDKVYTGKNGHQLPVESVDKIYDTEFDIVIIAIEDKDISNHVKDMLITNGIPVNKISQI